MVEFNDVLVKQVLMDLILNIEMQNGIVTQWKSKGTYWVTYGLDLTERKRLAHSLGGDYFTIFINPRTGGQQFREIETKVPQPTGP